MDDLGEAHELERDQLDRAVDVEVTDRIVVALDRNDGEVRTGPTDDRASRIVFGLARSRAMPRALPPISAATASARDASRPLRTVSRPVAA